MTDAKKSDISLVDVEHDVLEFPCTGPDGTKFGVETADALAASFAEFGDQVKPPLVLGGHNDKADNVADPASGKARFGRAVSLVARQIADGVKRVRVKISGVPAGIADLAKKGAFSGISGSFWPDGAKANIPAAAGKPLFRHVAWLGGETPWQKSLPDLAAVFGAEGSVPAQSFADADPAAVAVSLPPTVSFADAMAGPAAPAEAKPPETLKAAVEGEAQADALQPLFSGIQSRLWVLQDEGRKGKEAAAIVAGLKDLGAELQSISEKMLAQPGMPPAAAAASMSDAEAEKAAAAAASAAAANPQSAIRNPQSAVVSLSDDARQSVEVLITRLTAGGRLLPAIHPAIRAAAVASFAHGGREALDAYLADQEALRQAKVIDLGETGKAGTEGRRDEGTKSAVASFADADPAAVAKADEEFAKVARSFPGMTREAFVAAYLAGSGPN